MEQTQYYDKIKYFDNLSQNWDTIVGNDNNRLQRIRNIFTLIKPNKGSTILDVGCGTGVLFPIIEEYIGKSGKLIAVDASQQMIAVAKERHKQYTNISYMVDLVESISLESNSVDTILCFAVFPHIENKLVALQKFNSILQLHGSLFIFHLSSTHNLNEFHHNLNAPVKKDYMPSKEELEDMLHQAGFTMLYYIDEPDLNFIHAKLK